MSSGLYTWSQTAATNATADSTINWAEGQAPSSINDSARAMMAGIAKYRDDIAGAIVTGGSSTAYTVSSYQVFDTLAHLNGQMIAFAPNATNTNTVGNDVTLSVDSLGAKPIRIQPSVALPNGTLVSGTSYVVVYNNSDGVFYLQNMTNPYNIPLAGGLPFFGSTAPNSSFAFPYGQAISRATYSTLFTLLSTTYGTGDGSTTFNIPDLRGRVIAGVDNMGGSAANRITSGGSGITGTTLGATGGAQTQTLVTNNLPPFTPAGSITATLSTPGFSVNGFYGPSGGSVGYGGGASGGTAYTISGATVTSSFTGTAQGGISTPVVTTQPTIMVNYILRII